MSADLVVRTTIGRTQAEGVAGPQVVLHPEGDAHETLIPREGDRPSNALELPAQAGYRRLAPRVCSPLSESVITIPASVITINEMRIVGLFAS